MIGNWMLRNVLEPKEEEVKGGWTKLHNANLRDWYPVKILTRRSNVGCYGRGMGDSWGRTEIRTGFWLEV
jgi:hypothetical protein